MTLRLAAEIVTYAYCAALTAVVFYAVVDEVRHIMDGKE